MLALGKTKFDKRKEDWLVQKFGLRQLESLDAIQAEPPFLLITQEDNLVPRVLSYSAPVAREKGRWERGCQEERRRLCSARLLVAYMTDAKKEEEGKKRAKPKRGRDPFPSLPIFLLFFPFRSPQRRLNILGNYSYFSPHLTPPFALVEKLVGSLSSDNGHGIKNDKKAIGWDWQNNDSNNAFSYISFPSLHDY